MTTEKLTQETLDAMPDAELNRLAAEIVLGLRWQDGAGFDKSGVQQVNRYYSPTTDRSQSGALLAKMAERGVLFDIAFGHWESDERPYVEVYKPLPRDDWSCGNEWLVVVPGNSARSETIAAILAVQMLEGKQ